MKPSVYENKNHITINYLSSEYYREGCFVAGAKSIMPDMLGNLINEKYAVSECALLALANDYIVFGMKNGGECWSGHHVEKTFHLDGKSSQCKKGLGGINAYDVYALPAGKFCNTFNGFYYIACNFRSEILIILDLVG